MTEKLHFLALGGAGEIGMNCYLYGIGEGKDQRWIMVDCGVTFGDMANSPGIELVLPDVAFIAAERKKLAAIFITHAHEDHVGAIGRLWPRLKAPIYATGFTAEIVGHKLTEAGVEAKVNVVHPGQRVEAGPFTIEFLPMTHSIPETSALLIDTPAGRVFHTADFKMDPRPTIDKPVDAARLREIGDAGVMLLVCDSTNVFEEGRSGSESDLHDGLRRVFASAEGAVAATTFASNVARLKTLAEVAIAAGRKVIVVGRAMSRMIEAAVKTGAIDSFPAVITDSAAESLPRNQRFYLVTGSQGEGRAALARIAGGTHPAVKLVDGDVVIYSARPIPGNERDINFVANKLSERGVRMVDDRRENIHVSGHAYRDELAELYRLLRPQLAIPMHGEHRHLVEHARMATEWGAGSAQVAPNGTWLTIENGQATVAGEVETGRIYLDGEVLVGARDGVVRDRLRLARNGVVAVTVIVDDKGASLGDSEVRVMGLPVDGPGWAHPIDELIAEEVDQVVSKLSKADRLRDEKVEEAVSLAVKRLCGRLWGKKPEVIAICLRMEE